MIAFCARKLRPDQDQVYRLFPIVAVPESEVGHAHPKSGRNANKTKREKSSSEMDI